VGGTLLFACGVTPEPVMEAFGMDPASARLVPVSRFDEALHDLDWMDTHPPEAAQELSAGTDVVLFSHTQTIDERD